MKNVIIYAKCNTNTLKEKGYSLDKWYHLAIYPNDNNPGLTLYNSRPNAEKGKKLDYASITTFLQDWIHVSKLDQLKKPKPAQQLDLFTENTIKNYDKNA